MADKRNTKVCPSCAEEVREAALRCKHCGHLFVSAEWLAHARAYAGMAPRQRADWLRTLSPEQGREFWKLWRAIGPEEESKLHSGAGELNSGHKGLPEKESKKTGRRTLGLLAVLLVVGFVAIVASLTPNTGSQRGASSRRTARPSPTPPSLSVSTHDCSQKYDMTTLVGVVKNAGRVPVGFVMIDARFMDATGEIVDTDWTYAVGTESLGPGQTAAFKAYSRHSDATRCKAYLKSYKPAN